LCNPVPEILSMNFIDIKITKRILLRQNQSVFPLYCSHTLVYVSVRLCICNVEPGCISFVSSFGSGTEDLSRDVGVVGG